MLNNKLELNFNQKIGLLIFSIAIFLRHFEFNKNLLMALFSVSVFILLIFSKVNFGVWLSLILAFIAMLFKITHWPGGDIIFSASYFTFFISIYFHVKKASIQIWFPIYISAFFLLGLSLLAFLNFPIPDYLMYLATGFFLLSYTIRYLKKADKIVTDHIKLALFLSSFFYLVFNLLHWPGSVFFLFLSIFFLWFWLIPSLLKS